jgi:hypothetical protein
MVVVANLKGLIQQVLWPERSSGCLLLCSACQKCLQPNLFFFERSKKAVLKLRRKGKQVFNRQAILLNFN